jgi:hypothetical protein
MDTEQGMQNMRLKFLFLTMAVALLSSGQQSFAQSEMAGQQDAQTQQATSAVENKNSTPYELNLPGCDFTITFPGEPTTARRCNAEDPLNCSRIISYTKVIGLEATINYNVSCNVIEEETFDRYTGEVLKATLDSMIGPGKTEEFQSDYADLGDYKQAIVIGNNKINETDSIYTAQIWVGKKSLFTVEGELIGFAGEEVDKQFADILASAGPIALLNKKKEAPKESADAEEKSDGGKAEKSDEKEEKKAE